MAEVSLAVLMSWESKLNYSFDICVDYLGCIILSPAVYFDILEVEDLELHSNFNF